MRQAITHALCHGRMELDVTLDVYAAHELVTSQAGLPDRSGACAEWHANGNLLEFSVAFTFFYVETLSNKKIHHV